MSAVVIVTERSRSRNAATVCEFITKKRYGRSTDRACPFFSVLIETVHRSTGKKPKRFFDHYCSHMLLQSNKIFCNSILYSQCTYAPPQNNLLSCSIVVISLSPNSDAHTKIQKWHTHKRNKCEPEAFTCSSDLRITNSNSILLLLGNYLLKLKLEICQKRRYPQRKLQKTLFILVKIPLTIQKL